MASLRYLLELGDCTVTVAATSRDVLETVFEAVCDALIPAGAAVDIDELNERLGIADLLSD